MNVVDLSLARALRKSAKTTRLVVISDRQVEILNQFLPSIEIVRVHQHTQFSRLGGNAYAIDAKVSWCDPAQMTQSLNKLDLPVVWLSTKRKASTAKAAYAAGASDILYAPFDPEECLEAISILLKLRRLA